MKLFDPLTFISDTFLVSEMFVRQCAIDPSLSRTIGLMQMWARNTRERAMLFIVLPMYIEIRNRLLSLTDTHSHERTNHEQDSCH